MEVFNKIYSQVSSSVSSAASQLSGVLPGNPVTREFDASDHVASAGPGLLWKIYRGTKRSTKQEASIFVFEKRQLDKYSKSDRDIILEVLRRGVTQLTKIRHPQVLTVQHPLEESRESLAFATEPVFASLANVLGENYNMPLNHQLSEYKFFDIEIKYGLLQIGEGLTFLHNDMKLLHKNICPETIVVNHQGAWKIFGFDFCVHNTAAANTAPNYPLEEYVPSLPGVAQPSLDYLAPECIVSQTQSPASDLFSLGMVAFTLYSPSHLTFMPVRDLKQFRMRVATLKNLPPNKLSSIPEALKEFVKLMLHVQVDLRPDAHQFIKIPYFEDVGVKTLNYLDSLLQWDNLQKSQFYKGLPESLAKLPQRVRLQRVFPCLVRDLTQPAMVPFVLPNILDIAQHCSQREFVKYILPSLKPVMKLTEPVQILLIFLNRMELMLKLTPPDDVQQHVLPMLYRGLDADTPQIHELCLSILPTFAGLLDHANFKNHLLPRIKKLCLSTNSLSVRVNCLLCIGRLLEHLDKWLVLDEVLPFLPQIPSREPAVLMGILGIYKLALNHKKLGISKEIMATRVLPFLMPLCIENGLNLSQFNALVALVKQMFNMVESEHRTKLEQLNSVQQEKRCLEAAMPEMAAPVNGTPAAMALDGAFGGLGLDAFMSPSKKPSTAIASLSIQEKQKFAQQQESMNMFKTQTPLEPLASSTVTQPQNKIAPKDLTQELSKTPMVIPTISSPPLVKPQSFKPMTTSMTFPSAMATPMNQNAVNGNGFAKPMWSQPTAMHQQWTNGHTQNKNWSALDNLLPNSMNSLNLTATPSVGRTPMNQMMGSQPLLSAGVSVNANMNKNNANALSTDEIMDLLS